MSRPEKLIWLGSWDWGVGLTLMRMLDEFWLFVTIYGAFMGGLAWDIMLRNYIIGIKLPPLLRI